MPIIKQISNKTTTDFMDVKMDHITVMSNKGWTLDQSISDLKKNPKIETNNSWTGLCTTGLGPCIGMAAIGKDKNGHIVQGIIHLSDIVNINESNESLDFFDALKNLMKTCGCTQFETYLFGGNELTTPLREKIMAFSSDEFPIKNYQQNLSSDEEHYTNIYLIGENIQYEEIVIDKKKENEAIALKLLSNQNIFQKIAKDLFSSCSSSSSSPGEYRKKNKIEDGEQDDDEEEEEWLEVPSA